jgi:hypothetical protein
MEDRVDRVASSPLSFLGHSLVSILPVGIHRALTDRRYLRERLYHIAVRPVRLYFDAELREEWLRDLVQEGREKRLITADDSVQILSRIKEPFIQKYLKALAVHVCTVPVTQVVSVLVAVGYVLLHPEMPRAQSWAIGLGIIALFQVVPISPGSLTRGFYVVWLVLKDRNFKDYNIAVFLAFFKYVGYLAFPIQMAYRYPTLSRFMAVHWATEAVHVVPVFGESGALLEHKVFTWFYNMPLTLRGRMGRRSAVRSSAPHRLWHVVPIAALGALALGTGELLYGRWSGVEPTLADIWWVLLTVSLLCGALATLGAGGTRLGRRFLGGALCGAVSGVLFSVGTQAMAGWNVAPTELLAGTVWIVFILTVLSTIGAVVTEVILPEPRG